MNQKIYSVIPTKVGTQKKRQGVQHFVSCAWRWVPTFVGMTVSFYSLFPILFLLTIAQVHAEIIIGVAGPLSGTYSAYGGQMVQGVQAAVDHLNATGGIEGELVEIVTADEACDNRQAEIAAQNLVQKNVTVVIGHYCSYSSLTAAKIYESAGIPMIAPAGSLPAFTEAGLSNVIRLVARDDAQGEFAAQRMKVDFAADRIAVLSDGSASAELLVARFIAANGAAPALSLKIKPDLKSTDDLIVALATKNIAALYCACAGSDAGFIVAQISAANLAIKIYGSDALLVPQFWEKSGAAGEGTFVSFAVDPQTYVSAHKLIKQLAASDIGADGATLPSYAAVQLFASAAEKMGSKNGRGLSAYLRSGASFSTVIGSLSFDAHGDVLGPRLTWYVWSKGKSATEYLVK